MPIDRVEIIAEVANAHQGDPDQAILIAEAALKAGADAVKFQVYSAEELLVRSHPRYEHFSRQAFSQAVWTDLLAHFVCRKEKVYCDVFGLDALGIAQEAEVDGIKIHSSDLSNHHLLDIAREQQDAIASSQDQGGPIEPTRIHNRTPGRNAPCFCGSGKKYKRCCMGKSNDNLA